MNLANAFTYRDVLSLCTAAALLLGLTTSCSENPKAQSKVPATVHGNDPRPHLATIAFQNRGEGPSTAHYTFNGREMGTYSEGLRNVVRELESAEEPYVLILHPPSHTIAEAGGNVDDLNTKFASALAGKRVLQYGMDSNSEPIVIYIAMTNDKRAIYELNGQRVTDVDVLNALGTQRSRNGLIVAIDQGRYRLAEPDEIRPVADVSYTIEDYSRAYGIVRRLSLQDSAEWEIDLH